MRRHLLAFVLSVLALPLGLACVGTPLPDPPSARPEAMTLTPEDPNVRLTGRMSAIELAGRPSGTLRVSNPTTDARVLVAVAADGTFTGALPGVTTDVLYLELVEAPSDLFLVAVSGFGTGDGVTMAPAGPDGDMDGSPDAVDCAPADDTLRARECTMICASDVDCAAGEACLMGVCQPTCVPVGEICRNGLDDDCDGMLDELDCM